jgi:hypothetical protein
MNRYLAALAVLACTAASAPAHFIWIVPDGTGSTARVVFSDTLQPDSPELLAKIGKTDLYVRAADGTVTPLKWTAGKDAYHLAVPGDAAKTVAAVCTYGVIQRGKAEPFLLVYHAKAHLGRPATEAGGEKPFDRLGLEIVRLPDEKGPRFRVVWQGKPLPGAEVVIVPPGDSQREEQKTDRDGTFTVKPGQPGVYGVRARHVEPRDGEHAGQKYREARHYSTLVVQLGAAGKAEKDRPAERKEDPEASKLLADARAARANWDNFLGFTADLTVNLDGKVSRGTVRVEPRGKLELTGLDKAAEAWVRRTLGSAVAHRLDGSAARKTPCAFADNDVDHPLGRKIIVLNDELHSSYRIRDRQITVVNRDMGTTHFTIAMQENRANDEGKFLPVSYVVNSWDNKTGALTRSEAHYQSWKKVGPYDLPLTIRVVTAVPEDRTAAPKEGMDVRSLTLSNHKLTGAATR